MIYVRIVDFLILNREKVIFQIMLLETKKPCKMQGLHIKRFLLSLLEHSRNGFFVADAANSFGKHRSKR